MNQKISLVVSDVDGTFITKAREITPATHNALKTLRECGVMVVLASSRPLRGMQHFLEAAGMLALNSPVISMNGAMISTADGATLLSKTIEHKTVRALYEAMFDLISAEGFNVMLLDECEWWSSGYDELVKKEAHSLRFEPHWQDLDKRLRSPKPINKITILGEPERVQEAKRRIDADFTGKVSASSPANPRFLDITAPNVHKGTAITHLAEHLGITREQICAIGDGENDVEMFRTAGVSVAMGHASEAVKSEAMFTTASNLEDGWAQSMERFVLHLNNDNLDPQ